MDYSDFQNAIALQSEILLSVQGVSCTFGNRAFRGVVLPNHDENTSTGARLKQQIIDLMTPYEIVLVRGNVVVVNGKEFTVSSRWESPLDGAEGEGLRRYTLIGGTENAG